ncbi:helix-turn-helix domain-containing protein [Vulcanococcus limneticus]|uniref:helix-turn-helix domain-containing protein n=1 Tax=Vulcanococcus limneticus TaxID=2170428 RepID=UPI0018E38061|nr:helix-turn-helix domain-containing protein [Vulcanococcus limneticus]
MLISEIQAGDDQIHHYLNRQMDQMEAIVRMNRGSTAEQRVIRLLSWLARNFPQVTARRLRLSLRDMNLTHQDLAYICGLSRVTVSRCFRQLKNM